MEGVSLEAVVAAPEAAIAAPKASRAGTYRIVRVVGLEVVLPDQHPVLTLEDTEGSAGRLSFRIGTPEGVSLAHALAGTQAPRPLTHDLFALALERCGIEVVAVRLTGRVATTYFAELELAGMAGGVVLSCRPSDGVSLALRQRVAAPILCDERLFGAGDVAPAGTEIADPRAPGGAGG